jgi:hypothetical protein
MAMRAYIWSFFLVIYTRISTSICMYLAETYGVELRVLLEVLCARNVDEDVGEGTDCIRISAKHHVGETNVVVPTCDQLQAGIKKLFAWTYVVKWAAMTLAKTAFLLSSMSSSVFSASVKSPSRQ